ncbi:uncharacterized protein [Ambystoma mexicanum]|uniref:uncharacterized protein n=1 Tax=Ambystoma mexicanum TaxID=8296 RepID=UPI0037E7A270
MRLQTLFRLLLFAAGLVGQAGAGNMTSTNGIHAFMTHKFQMFTIPIKSASMGTRSTSVPVTNQKKDKDALRRLKNILMSLLESLPESRKPYAGPITSTQVARMGPAPANTYKRPNDLTLAKELDDDVSELLNSIRNNGEGSTKLSTSDMDMMQSIKKGSSEVVNPPSYVYTTSGRFQGAMKDSDSSLDKSIQMEENAQHILDKDIVTMKKAQQRLKGKDTSNDNDVLENIEKISKEVDRSPASFPKLPPYQESIKDTERFLDKRIQMEEKAQQLMDKEITSMKAAQKHSGSSDRGPPRSSSSARSSASRGTRSGSSDSPPTGPPPARVHIVQPEAEGASSSEEEDTGPPDDVQQLSQLMQYLDKYIPDLSSYLRTDTDEGATQKAFSLLALMKNFLCVGKEMQSQNTQKYFRPLIEDEIRILKMLLENSD